MPGDADLRQVAVAAEVYKNAPYRRFAQEVDGREAFFADAVRLAKSGSAARRSRRRRV